jgi:hypothetical protein
VSFIRPADLSVPLIILIALTSQLLAPRRINIRKHGKGGVKHVLIVEYPNDALEIVAERVSEVKIDTQVGGGGVEGEQNDGDSRVGQVQLQAQVCHDDRTEISPG